MATGKHTYIFLSDQDGITEDELYRLAFVAERHPVSWKGEMSDRHYTRVQVFTLPGEMHRLAHAAGFSGEQLRKAIPAARQRGDKAISEASQRLDDLRRKASIKEARENLHLVQQPAKPFIFIEGKDGVTSSMLKTMRRTIVPEFPEVSDYQLSKWTVTCTHGEIARAARIVGLSADAIFNARQRAKLVAQEALEIRDSSRRFPPLPAKPSITPEMQQRIDALRQAGCEITVTCNEHGYRIEVFGERLNRCQDDNYGVTLAHLDGLQRGFTSAPLWGGAQFYFVPRSTFNDVLRAVDDELAGHNLGSNATGKTLDRAMKKARRLIAGALVEPTAPGSPQMGSTKATRRSKRSA